MLFRSLAFPSWGRRRRRRILTMTHSPYHRHQSLQLLIFGRRDHHHQLLMLMLIQVCSFTFLAGSPPMEPPNWVAYILSRARKAPIKTPCSSGRYSILDHITLPPPPFLPPPSTLVITTNNLFIFFILQCIILIQRQMINNNNNKKKIRHCFIKKLTRILFLIARLAVGLI